MALNVFGRLSRFLRATFVPAALVFSFSILLTFVFILYKPGFGPGGLQRVGWQAWEPVFDSSSAYSGGNSGVGAVDEEQTVGDDWDVDWWNVTKPEGGADTASLPLDIWHPLLQHDTGLTEITIERCMWSSSMIDLCSPHSSADEDATKGKWVRVDRDLNLQAGMWHLFIYYRRTRRIDVPLITNLALLPANSPEPKPSSSAHSWNRVERSVRDGVMRAPSLFLWYEVGPTLRDIGGDGKANLITELDIVYGDGPAWYGFDKLEGGPTMEASSGPGRSNVWLTYRRGVHPPPKAEPLHMSRDGRFKIMQVADLHFSISSGACRDPAEPCPGGAYNYTSSLLGRTLDQEKPNLVVFTGDQLNGQGTVLDAKSVLAKFAREVADRKIPWAVVFGNHDDEDARETGWRSDQVKLMQGLPYSLVKAGPTDVHGVGNYVLKVLSADASRTQLLTLYFLDSGSYAKGITDWFGFWSPTEYDWIHQNQIDWFLQESAAISPIERPFVPDGAKDLAGVWARSPSPQQVAPTQRKLAKPNGLMFFHIPLPEAYDSADVDPSSGRPLDVGVSGLEGKGSASKSDGMLKKGLLAATESEHRGAGSAPEVKVVGNGHCHITENCRRISGVWMCFGGGGSYEGYGKVGFDRRFRVYDISDYGETIRTYKVLESGDRIDEMALAGKGAPAFDW
ncbi:Metallo-dependent phosphatase [Peniophora sp. CONT]|nr:Metallo-dependent phosphatase [Peniophora sp. CONT]